MKEPMLNKLKSRLASLRNRSANIRSSELQSLAKSLGREKWKGRGKEPTWISNIFPNARPISIPDHPGALPKFTARNILDQLEQDIFMFEDELDEKGEI